ncbi:MAG: discoidin domain-containing protein [Pirellulaceae bacterium]
MSELMTVITIVLLPTSITLAQQAFENVAKGRTYTMQPPPNYGLCTDAEDVTQLTDGVFTENYFWTQATTVGWQGTPVVLLTVDLGQTQPIAGLSYSTAAGVAGVAWPREIRIAVSDDGRLWRAPGDLVILSKANDSPPAEGYGTLRYETHELASRGRYVRLAVVTDGAYAFCDELEIFRGPDTLLTSEPQDVVTVDPEVATPMGWSETRTGIFRRLSLDMGIALAAVEQSLLSHADKAAQQTRLQALTAHIYDVAEPDLATFRTEIPLNDTHAAILAAHAPVMRAQGLPEFFAWRKHRYDPLSPHEVPNQLPEIPALDIAMMQGEVRADACLLTNASDQAVKVQVKIDFPGAPRPSWLTVSAVPWTDTAQRTPVAAALPETTVQQGEFVVPVPAGVTSKLWFTVDSTAMTPGAYAGALIVEAPGYQERLPFKVRVSRITMGRPRLSVGMWDYTDGPGAYGITEKNMQAAIALERSHGVDSPWAKGSALPWPAETDFDPEGNLRTMPSFETFDAWVQRWPGARNYLVFAAVGPSFAGASIDAPDFAPRVGSWAKALAQHMRDLKLDPRQLGLLLVDEPSTDEQDATIVAWAKAIKTGAAELTIFQDPCWVQPEKTRLQEAITLADIVCPQLSIFYSGGPAAIRYYDQLREVGHSLWFYQCSGPSRLFDPSRYHRLSAWHAFRHSASGIGFWAFGDTGGGASSWNEYAGTRTAFTPAFIGIDEVTDGIHWQAVREGIEDHEYLSMLRDAASRSENAALCAEAENLLQEAPEAVIGRYQADWAWVPKCDRAQPDVYRLRVLELLERMQ